MNTETVKSELHDFFTGMWSTVLLRGVISILFGVLAFLFPGITIAVLVAVFGFFAVIDGVTTLWSLFGSRPDNRNRLLVGLQGLAGIIVGLICILSPATGALYLVWLIGAFYVVTGIVEIFAAISLRKEIEGEFWLGLAGLLSVILGVFMFMQPAAGAVGIVWLISATAIAVGITLVMLGLRLRKAGETARAHLKSAS